MESQLWGPLLFSDAGGSPKSGLQWSTLECLRGTVSTSVDWTCFIKMTGYSLEFFKHIHVHGLIRETLRWWFSKIFAKIDPYLVDGAGSSLDWVFFACQGKKDWNFSVQVDSKQGNKTSFQTSNCCWITLSGNCLDQFVLTLPGCAFKNFICHLLWEWERESERERVKRD